MDHCKGDQVEMSLRCCCQFYRLEANLRAPFHSGEWFPSLISRYAESHRTQCTLLETARHFDLRYAVPDTSLGQGSCTGPYMKCPVVFRGAMLTSPPQLLFYPLNLPNCSPLRPSEPLAKILSRNQLPRSELIRKKVNQPLTTPYEQGANLGEPQPLLR